MLPSNVVHEENVINGFVTDRSADMAQIGFGGMKFFE